MLEASSQQDLNPGQENLPFHYTPPPLNGARTRTWWFLSSWGPWTLDHPRLGIWNQGEKQAWWPPEPLRSLPLLFADFKVNIFLGFRFQGAPVFLLVGGWPCVGSGRRGPRGFRGV